MEQQIQKFFNSLPPDLQKKIMKLPEEKQQIVIQQLMEKSQGQNQEQPAEQEQTAEFGATASKVPIEAERNENITVPKGADVPSANGGYLKRLSSNPISGETTYEIPDDSKNATHDQDGVDVEVERGSSVNSDKHKIKHDFLVFKRNFKGKTFKDASDYISKKEDNLQEKFNDNRKAGMVDDTSESSLALMLAKLALNRKDLNNLQESQLNMKNSADKHKYLDENKKKFGGIVKSAERSYSKYMDSIDTPGYVKAEKGLNTSIDKFNKFSEDIQSGTTVQDFAKKFHQDGLASNLKNTDSVDYKPIKSLSGDVRDRMTEATNFFVKNGYNPTQAAAITGNLMQESKLDPTVTNKIGAFGIAQWLGDRKVKFNTWADQQGASKYDFNTQLQYVLHELKTSHKGADDALLSASSLEDAVLAIRKKYEVPGESEAMDKKRLGYASYASTLAMPPVQYSQNKTYAQGGRVLAPNGYTDNKAWSTLQKEAKDSGLGDFQTPGEYQMYMQNQYPGLVIDRFNNNYGDKSWDVTNQGKGAGIDKPIDESTLDKTFHDNYYRYRGFVPQDASMPAADYDKFISTHKGVLSKQDGNMYYYDPSKHTYVMPDTADDAAKPALVPPVSRASHADIPDEELAQGAASSGVEKQANEDHTSFLDRLRAGLRNGAPYLAALSRMFEGRIAPVLQQKPYQNPYENLNTDVDVQDHINQADRALVSAASNTGGNPSVRNARMAQIYANLQEGKDSVLSQKYNMENQLKNQKEIGKMQYLNQFTDTNMAYKKRFEQEWLQTIENQRQQRYMAMDYMANLPLRKEEEDAKIALGLENSIYDYDPVTHKLRLNPEKAKLHAKEEKYTYVNNAQTIDYLKKQIAKYKKDYKPDDNTDDDYKMPKKYGGYIKN